MGKPFYKFDNPRGLGLFIPLGIPWTPSPQPASKHPVPPKNRTTLKFPYRQLFAVGFFAVFGLCDVSAQDEDPFTRLFDASVPLVQQDKMSGNVDKKWQAIPEDVTKHEFKGDVVLQNDKIRLLIRKKGGGVEMFARNEGGFSKRAVLRPLSASQLESPLQLKSLAISENKTSGVLLECSYVPQNGQARISFNLRLAAGDISGEMTPGEGMAGIAVESEPEYVISPDLLGSDVVFAPQQTVEDSVLLPSESLCLHLGANGNAMTLCLWKRGTYRAEARITSSKTGRIFSRTIFTSKSGSSFWFSVFEGTEMWKKTLVDASSCVSWKPPFPAKWRADVLTGVWPPVSMDYSDGLSMKDASVAAGTPVVIYPLDRSRETPMSLFSPVDIMRNVLGVGPCQFILDAEGGSGAEENYTAQQVALWTEKQLKKNKLQKADLDGRVSKMKEQMSASQARIEQYSQASVRLQKLSAASKPKTREGSGLKDAVLLAAGGLLKDIESSRAVSSPEYAAATGSAISGQIGAAGMDASIPPLAKKLAQAGVAHEKLIARSRMTMFWLLKQGEMLVENKNADADFGSAVIHEAGEFFKTKK